MNMRWSIKGIISWNQSAVNNSKVPASRDKGWQKGFMMKAKVDDDQKKKVQLFKKTDKALNRALKSGWTRITTAKFNAFYEAILIFGWEDEFMRWQESL